MADSLRSVLVTEVTWRQDEHHTLVVGDIIKSTVSYLIVKVCPLRTNECFTIQLDSDQTGELCASLKCGHKDLPGVRLQGVFVGDRLTHLQKHPIK